MGVAGHLLLGAGCPRPCRVVLLPCSPPMLPLPFWKLCQLPGCASREMSGSCSCCHSPGRGWTDFGCDRLQPFILHPSEMPSSTNTNQGGLGGSGCLQAVFCFAACCPRGMKCSGRVMGWGCFTPCCPSQHRAWELWSGVLVLDHEEDFQHLIYAMQLLLFCISVSLDTEER